MTSGILRTALSKGISNRRMLRKHAVPAAAAPVLTLAGVSVPVMVTNMVLVAIAYVLGSLFVGLAAVYVGIVIGRLGSTGRGVRG